MHFSHRVPPSPPPLAHRMPPCSPRSAPAAPWSAAVARNVHKGESLSRRIAAGSGSMTASWQPATSSFQSEGSDGSQSGGAHSLQRCMVVEREHAFSGTTVRVLQTHLRDAQRRAKEGREGMARLLQEVANLKDARQQAEEGRKAAEAQAAASDARAFAAEARAAVAERTATIETAATLEAEERAAAAESQAAALAAENAKLRDAAELAALQRKALHNVFGTKPLSTVRRRDCM